MKLMFLEKYFVRSTVPEGFCRGGFDPRIKARTYHFTRVCPSVFKFVFRLRTKQTPVSTTYETTTR